MKKILKTLDNLIESTRLKRLSSTRILILSFILWIITYKISQKIIEVPIFNIILGTIASIIPFMILDFIKEKNENKVRDAFTNTILQLKNYADIENDIIFSFKSIENECMENFRPIIKQFLAQINSGSDVTASLREIKEKVNLKIWKTFFDNLIFCYIYGGNYKDLLKKTYVIINELNEEQKKRQEETKSAIIVLYIMIFIDLLIYFSFINSNSNYLNILQNTLLGNIVISSNSIAIIFVIWLGNIVKRVDK